MTSQADAAVLATLSGQSESHLRQEPESGCLMHFQVIQPFAELRLAAREAGFELAVASSFRSFERQRLIWNEKVAGRRPVLDDDGQRLELDGRNDLDKVFAILRWSALPGASRHHWGSDLDVYDRSALEPGSGPQLTEAECGAGGPFYAFHRWLDEYLPESGFFRPYELDRGGVGCEPWHISFAPVSRRYQGALTQAWLASLIARFPFRLSDVVLNNLDEIFPRFIAPPLHAQTATVDD